MIVKKIAIGNSEEAYIEDSFSKGVNVILSDENNKGKTIVTQSILYACGNKPIYPSSFNYKEYIYYGGLPLVQIRKNDEQEVWNVSGNGTVCSTGNWMWQEGRDSGGR